jgi:hypothetical protein
MLYPLLFGYQDLIAGAGFIAGVRIDGCALIDDDHDEEVWVYGVQPGGLAADGASQIEATSEFRSIYRKALFDIAASASDFDDFKAEVEYFFNDVNDVLRVDWEDARTRVREGSVESDWLKKRISTSSSFSLEVVQISEASSTSPKAQRTSSPSPTQNKPDRFLLAS